MEKNLKEKDSLFINTILLSFKKPSINRKFTIF